jgi:hypothetical protein
MLRSVVVSISVVLTISLARAEEPTPAPPPPAPSDEFNFELTPPGESKPALVQSEAEKLRLARLEERVILRRKLLLAHQAVGFVTLGLLLATDVLGTLNWYDKFGGGGDTGKYYDWHFGLAMASTATFATSAALALFAPNPYPKPIKWDTALVHKLSMAIAAACFVTQIILGPISWAAEGKLYQKDLALAHTVVGWSAFGFMTIGTGAYIVK